MKQIIDRMSSYYHGLSPNEQKIADYIKEHEREIPELTIHELSKEIDVSAPTISRFVRSIGYSSYSIFRIELSKSNVAKNEEFFFEFSDDDSLKQILEKTFFTNISSLRSTVDMITKEKLYQAMIILMNASACGFFGIGGSSIVAYDAYHMFIRTPLRTLYSEDFHAQQLQAAKLTKKDCALVISHTGRNKDILRIIDILKDEKVPIIAITSFASSPLASKADVTLVSISEEMNYRPEAFTSVISQISLIEALFMMYGIQVKKSSKKMIDKFRKIIDASRLPG